MADFEALYREAMKVTEQAQADEILEKLIQSGVECGLSRESSINLQKGNLGYMAGYYDHETRECVERLFNCVHPVFGPIAKNGPPTPEQAFQAGVDLASGKFKAFTKPPFRKRALRGKNG